MSETVDLNEDITLTAKYEPIERVLPGGFRVYIHPLTFEDVHHIRRLALTYKSIKTGNQDYASMKPDEDILRLFTVIKCCRTSEGDPSFNLSIGHEVDAIDRLRRYLPGAMVELICFEAEQLSLSGYIPPRKREEQNAIDEARKTFIDMLAEPETWEHLNYLCVRIYGRPLCEESGNMASVLNVLQREDEAANRLVEAISMFMQAMSQVS